MPRSEKDINTEPCNICGKVIRYKSDMPRHNRLHTTNKAELCHFPGCGYQNLQKSNVVTHFRTHTGEKPKSCPDCEYTTSDPGSLTRHRKRIHGYVPKERNLAVNNKRSRRHAPYIRESSDDSSSNASFTSTSSASPQIEDKAFDISTLYEPCFSTPQFNTGNAFSYPWDKTHSPTQEFLAAASSEPFISVLPSKNNPRHLSSGINSGHSLEFPVSHSSDLLCFLDYLPSTSYENLLLEPLSQKDLEFLSPVEGEGSQASHFSWETLESQELSILEVPSPQSWDFTFGSPASFYTPSPSPPSDFSFYDSSMPETSDMLDFLFPDPHSIPVEQSTFIC
ncbi:hypothetical protein BDZ94DRAFT_1234608 [Collybia nuda]|uniref:C2H2-type domain-containing protein n=1 Tax=Collybia nuda TaxID=64659 RepID=A0A9P5YB50_9AGAR|nr:hypothetical protein BDZ94DRAFT_1234608 [Collybia nuda]